jgi:hypothetical protein
MAEMWSPMTGQRTLEDILKESGARLSRRNENAAYVARVAEAAEFVGDVIAGKRPSYLLQEALSTSDFPLLMGDVLDRQLLGNYASFQPTWQNYCKRGRVRDFRTVRRIQVDGLTGRFYPSYLKPEMTPPTEDNSLAETGYTYNVEVYEKAAALNWKMLVNDDLDAFADIPRRLALGARYTEEYYATTLFVTTTGPHGSMYSTGSYGNVVTGNPALSIAGLQTAMQILGAMTDSSGEPIVVDAVELVVPPALEVTALNILNATQILVNPNASAGTAQQELFAQNWMRNKVRLSVNPYIPIVASSSNANTSWFLFANPDRNRPAIEIGFLSGYETPGLYQKAPNTMRIGGGVDTALGDFDTGELRYKGMHIIGGCRLDPKATVASNGSGS